MKRCVTFLGALVLAATTISANPTLGAGAVATAQREVNVTTESEPGWIPSEALERAARDSFFAYFDAEDSGRAEVAYGLLADLQRQNLPYDEFEQSILESRRLAGGVIERSIVKITWTKDPAAAPAPGIYAAIDMTGRFENIDRYCGYAVLYQPPGSDTFGVMRTEKTYMTNEVAEELGESEAVASWARYSAVCPNYPLPEQPRAEGDDADVAETRAMLSANPAVEWSQQNGWDIAADEENLTIWSFSPPEYPAHPAVVRRAIRETPGGTVMEMSVFCEADKAACDSLAREFQALYEQIR